MGKTPPREVPNRNEYYMGLAFWIASKSKDPNTQCGAVIINKDNFILSTGYNGPPARISDFDINWERPFKRPYIVHAEANALNYNKGSLEEATIYVTARPCSPCALRIASTSIARIVYFDFKYDEKSMLADGEDQKLTEEICRLAKVKLEVFNGNLNWMRDRIICMESIGIFN